MSGLTAGDLHLLAESIDALNEKMDELLAGRDERGVAMDLSAPRSDWGPVYVPYEVYVAPVGDILTGSETEAIRLVWSGDPELGFALQLEVSE